MSPRIALAAFALALATAPVAAWAGTVRITSSIDRVTVFTNAASGDINVVYLLEDGNFGLIEPQAGTG